MTQLKEVATGLQDFLKLRTLPIGVKFLEKVGDMDKIPKVRRPDHRLSLCQAIAMSRYLGLTLGITVHDLAGPSCIYRLGFSPRAEEITNGTYFQGVWMKNQEDAAKYVQATRCLPLGKYKAIVLSPLVSGRLDPPDIALIYGTPAQINLLMNGLQWENYERLQFFFVGEGSCADSLMECYYSGKPQLTVPSLGERVMGNVAEDGAGDSHSSKHDQEGRRWSPGAASGTDN